MKAIGQIEQRSEHQFTASAKQTDRTTSRKHDRLHCTWQLLDGGAAAWLAVVHAIALLCTV